MAYHAAPGTTPTVQTPLVGNARVEGRKDASRPLKPHWAECFDCDGRGETNGFRIHRCDTCEGRGGWEAGENCFPLGNPHSDVMRKWGAAL